MICRESSKKQRTEGKVHEAWLMDGVKRTDHYKCGLWKRGAEGTQEPERAKERERSM